jgi:hypothetical protein
VLKSFNSMLVCVWVAVFSCLTRSEDTVWKALQAHDCERYLTPCSNDVQVHVPAVCAQQTVLYIIQLG